METMERKRPRPRRSFTEEFKADIVDRLWEGKTRFEFTRLSS
jgi:transposase-like protein